MRPPSSVASAIRIPWPGAPSSSPGVSSNDRSAVEEEFRPIFSSSRVTAKPGAPARTTSAVGPCSASRAKTRNVAAYEPLVIHCFVARDPAAGDAAAHRAGVGPRARLGQRERADLLAGRQRRDQPLDLLGRAVREQRQRARARVHRDGHADAGVGARELLEHQHVGEEVGARAAVLLGHADAHQPEPSELAEQLARERVLAVPAGGVRARSARRRSARPGRGSRAAPA